MNLERFIYIDTPGIASLYAQLRGEDVVETLLGMEHGRSSSWRLAISAFLGGSGESSEAQKETQTTKITLRPENMLREIVASLRAHGSLYDSLPQAIKIATETQKPVWFESRHPFSVPPKLDEFNRMRVIVFVSGIPPYSEPSADFPEISMSANLHNFPSAHDGQLSYSGHDALFFRQLKFLIFGSVFVCGDGFQVKPYAIRL